MARLQFADPPHSVLAAQQRPQQSDAEEAVGTLLKVLWCEELHTWMWARSCSRTPLGLDLDGKGVGSNRHNRRKPSASVLLIGGLGEPAVSTPSLMHSCSSPPRPRRRRQNPIGGCPDAPFSLRQRWRGCKLSHGLASSQTPRALTAQGPMAKTPRPRATVPSGGLPVGPGLVITRMGSGWAVL